MCLNIKLNNIVIPNGTIMCLNIQVNNIIFPDGTIIFSSQKGRRPQCQIKIGYPFILSEKNALGKRFFKEPFSRTTFRKICLNLIYISFFPILQNDCHGGSWLISLITLWRSRPTRARGSCRWCWRRWWTRPPCEDTTSLVHQGIVLKIKMTY